MKKSYRVKKEKNFNRCLIKTILCKSSFRGVRFRETTTSPFSSGDFCWEENWKRGHKNAVKRKIRASLFQLKDRISPEIDFIVSMRKTQELQPQLKALQQKYSSKDPETQRLFREEQQRLCRE